MAKPKIRPHTNGKKKQFKKYFILPFQFHKLEVHTKSEFDRDNFISVTSFLSLTQTSAISCLDTTPHSSTAHTHISTTEKQADAHTGRILFLLQVRLQRAYLG